MTSDADFRAMTLLALMVERRVGLHYSPSDRRLLDGKLRDHADQQGFDTLLDYYRSVEYDDPEGARFRALVDALVVGETFFFRERAGLERVVEIVARRAALGLPSRVWSAACASGEEILSLAALLAEAQLLDRVRLVASDVSDRHLARARSGAHTLRSLRLAPEGMPPWITARDRVATVDPGLRARVHWCKVNLVEPAEIAGLGPFDAILCRNVLIYFDDATVMRVVSSLCYALVPGGTLVIGVSESLLRFGSALRCVEQRGTFLYQRPGAPA